MLPKPINPDELLPAFQMVPFVSIKLVAARCGMIASIDLLLKNDTSVKEMRLFMIANSQLTAGIGS